MLALPQIGGTYASLHGTGSSVRSIRDGLAYRNGFLSAQMAMRGIKGDPDVFDGKYGFYQAYYKGAYNRSRLLEGLGQDYETARYVAEAVAVSAPPPHYNDCGAGNHDRAWSVVR